MACGRALSCCNEIGNFRFFQVYSSGGLFQSRGPGKVLPFYPPPPISTALLMAAVKYNRKSKYHEEMAHEVVISYEKEG